MPASPTKASQPVPKNPAHDARLAKLLVGRKHTGVGQTQSNPTLHPRREGRYQQKPGAKNHAREPQNRQKHGSTNQHSRDTRGSDKKKATGYTKKLTDDDFNFLQGLYDSRYPIPGHMQTLYQESFCRIADILGKTYVCQESLLESLITFMATNDLGIQKIGHSGGYGFPSISYARQLLPFRDQVEWSFVVTPCVIFLEMLLGSLDHTEPNIVRLRFTNDLT